MALGRALRLARLEEFQRASHTADARLRHAREEPPPVAPEPECDLRRAVHRRREDLEHSTGPAVDPVGLNSALPRRAFRASAYCRFFGRDCWPQGQLEPCYSAGPAGASESCPLVPSLRTTKGLRRRVPSARKASQSSRRPVGEGVRIGCRRTGRRGGLRIPRRPVLAGDSARAAAPVRWGSRRPRCRLRRLASEPMPRRTRAGSARRRLRCQAVA